ncbi:hypothetical protein G3T14_15385 [Methylobacterium sp. BTF04]|uniref:hypothetical protein n=1 Tax=Methylobacterium sp. BTF04 TaxID=2708300 RepID=UPI0013D18C6B|nr:hypothetical protein [Methylobacterium sp. BTF04]NEU13504.1 hypothetical protein [Methylobacterium sp. BTF04]
MPALRPFTHLTWITGHSVVQDPGRYLEPARMPMQEHLASLLAHGRAEVPNFPGSHVRLRSVGKGFLASVHTSDANRDIKVVTFGYAPDDICAGAIWREVSQGPTIWPKPKRPSVPWCTVELQMSDPIASMETAAWVGDYQRCLVFAWQDRSNAH